MRRGSRRGAITRVSFEDYATEWLDTYAGRTARGIGPRTLAEYRRGLSQWAIPLLGNRPLAEVTPADLRRLVAKLGEGHSAGTVRKYLQPVRAMFATAHEDGEIESNPTATVRVPRPQRSDATEPAQALTEAEWLRLRGEIGASWRPLFDLMYETGLRISEVLGLDWTDFALGTPEVPRVPPMLKVRRQFYRGELDALKTHEARRDLPLSQATAKWARANRTEGAVFASRSGSRLVDRNVRRTLTAAGERAVLDRVTPHSLRHSCASRLLASGRTIRQVAGWLGHTDPSFTLRTYVHLMDAGVGGPLALPRENALATQQTETAANDSRSERVLVAV